jgi:hypothetical protein
MPAVESPSCQIMYSDPNVASFQATHPARRARSSRGGVSLMDRTVTRPSAT